MLLARQFQNGTLARFPDAERELAIFAFAASTYMLFNAALIFLPQMTNLLARSRHALRLTLRFALAVSLVLSMPPLLLAFSGPGADMLAFLFDISGATLDSVILYLRYLTPLILVNALRQYYSGLLVQCRHTRLVTLLNLVYLAATVLMLLLGLQFRWRAIETLALSQLTAAIVHLLLLLLAVQRSYRLPEREEHRWLTYREALRFFWPMALTSALFALSRPIVYAFASRLDDGVAVVAALRVSFDFALIFHNPLNQFRHLFVSFSHDDPRAIRRFLLRIMLMLSLLMLLAALTPLGALIFEHLLGISGAVLDMAEQTLLLLCLLPLIVTLRNYYHGLRMVERSTADMALGSILRTLAIYAVCATLYGFRLLDSTTAALALLAGFAAEAATVFVAYRRTGAARRH